MHVLKPRHLEAVLAANPIAEASSFHALPKQQSRRLVPMVDLTGGNFTAWAVPRR